MPNVRPDHYGWEPFSLQTPADFVHLKDRDLELGITAGHMGDLIEQVTTLRNLLAEALPTLSALADAHGFPDDDDLVQRIREAL